MDASYDPSKLKFIGKLETPTDGVTEYEKEGFLQAVKENILYYCLWTFFVMSNSDGTMKHMVLNSTSFTLDSIIKEYKTRLNKPDTFLEDNNRKN